MKRRQPWLKNLYSNKEYEDNYTDPSFLKDLRTNLHVRFYTLREAIEGATLLTNQLSGITGFLIIFYMLYSERLLPTNLLWPGCLITLLGYACFRGRSLIITSILEDSKTLLTVFMFGYIFSPVLHHLTDSISTDTIFSLTFVVMLIHVLFHDYGLSVAMVSGTISLNAAIFGSICLASRLSTSYHAFVLLVISAIFFVLYPIFTREYWRTYYVIPIVLICSYFLYIISTNVLSIYILVIMFVNVVCPVLFVIQQKQKYNIHGPWDEAIVEETTDANIDSKL